MTENVEQKYEAALERIMQRDAEALELMGRGGWQGATGLEDAPAAPTGD